MTDPIALVNEQAEDEGLWFIDATCSEAYLQAALRKLHAAVEARAPAATPRPAAFLAWAVDMFGPVAKLRSERLLRFIEEAIELSHADGMERITLNLVADRVYSRPAGHVPKEIGQTQACLETFAENIGLSSADEAEREWQRVQGVPREEWTRRHAAKAAAGIATVSRPHRVGGE